MTWLATWKTSVHYLALKVERETSRDRNMFLRPEATSCHDVA
jgi:hypothetical protein